MATITDFATRQLDIAQLTALQAKHTQQLLELQQRQQAEMIALLSRKDSPKLLTVQLDCDPRDVEAVDRCEEMLLRHEPATAPRTLLNIRNNLKGLQTQQFTLNLKLAIDALRKQNIVVRPTPNSAQYGCVATAAVADALNQPDAPSSLFVCSVGEIVNRWLLWHTVLPEVTPFYAVKCNPDKALVSSLAALGAGFDCASAEELKLVTQDFGLNGDRVIFANPCKFYEHVQYAESAGIDLMTLDTIDELHKIVAYHPRAKLVIRLMVDDSQSLMPFSVKFGVNEDEVKELLKACSAAGADVHGFAFHVGSGCLSASAYESALKTARNAFDAAIALGFNPRLLDIGGGFSGSEDDVVPFSTVAATIRPLLRSLFPGIKVIAEPGRFFAAKPYSFAVTINTTRVRFRSLAQLKIVNTVSCALDKDDVARTESLLVPSPACSVSSDSEIVKEVLYYLSDGVYGAFNSVVMDHHHPMPLLDPRSAQKGLARTPTERSCLFGPTCDSLDVIASDVSLPLLARGEHLWFKSHGAYTLAASSNFNGMPSAGRVYYC